MVFKASGQPLKSNWVHGVPGLTMPQALGHNACSLKPLQTAVPHATLIGQALAGLSGSETYKNTRKGLYSLHITGLYYLPRTVFETGQSPRPLQNSCSFAKYTKGFFFLFCSWWRSTFQCWVLLCVCVDIAVGNDPYRQSTPEIFRETTWGRSHVVDCCKELKGCLGNELLEGPDAKLVAMVVVYWRESIGKRSRLYAGFFLYTLVALRLLFCLHKIAQFERRKIRFGSPINATIFSHVLLLILSLGTWT